MDRQRHFASKLDDTERLTCTIEAAQCTQGHTEYVIKVQRGVVGDRSWQITKRYKDFVALHNVLQISGIDIPLPPKKVFGNMDREFVAERQLGLQNYLNVLLNHQLLSQTLPVKRFLDPDNYSTNFQESAFQHVSMFFRSEPTWEILEPLPEIGWRIRKQYFLVKNNMDAKQQYCLGWCDTGPDKYLSDKDVQASLKALLSLKHSYIVPMAFASCSDSGCISIRVLNSSGSLRDHICKTKLGMPHLKKYGNPKEFSVLQMNEIQTYGRQILETLRFLHEKGIPYGHLHTGNIILDGGVCKILELENHLLGVPSYYRPFVVQLRKVQTIDCIDIYSFGHVIYEMAFGEGLRTPTCDFYDVACSPQIKSVLESILTLEACKGGLPTASDLLTHPLFQDVHLNHGSDRYSLKLSSQLREALKDSKEKMENRLQEEQKTLRQLRRVSRAQALLTSEEEKLKRRQLTKKKLQVQNGSCKDDGRPVSPNSNASSCSASSTPPPPAPPPPSRVESEAKPADRLAFLGSIEAFQKTALRKTTTDDRSVPVT